MIEYDHSNEGNILVQMTKREFEEIKEGHYRQGYAKGWHDAQEQSLKETS